MAKRSSLLKRAIETVVGIALVVGLILGYNGWFWLSEGSPTIPQIEGRWWAGYYETTVYGRQWCVARFIKSPSGRLQMALLSSFGVTEYFDVERSSSSESFVYFTFTDARPKPAIRIEATQLYAGKRTTSAGLSSGGFTTSGRRTRIYRYAGTSFRGLRNRSLRLSQSARINWKAFGRGMSGPISQRHRRPTSLSCGGDVCECVDEGHP
jgi:hypothetical protein